MRRYGIAGLVLLTFSLWGDEPGREAEEWVRRGDAAFARGDYPEAVEFYERAETDTTDPGLVALNKAAALYRLGRFADAERYYWRCRQDAQGGRLARVLYDLGNAVVQQARDQDAAGLERAIAWYRECLDQPGLDPALAQDARHNLEVAGKLWLKAKEAEKPAGSRPPDQGDHHAETGEDPKGEHERPGNDPNSGPPNPGETARPSPDHSTEPRPNMVPTEQLPPPGVGTLPPIPDEDELVPMSSEATDAYLRREAARIEQDRREHQRHSAHPPSPTLMDW